MNTVSFNLRFLPREALLSLFCRVGSMGSERQTYLPRDTTDTLVMSRSEPRSADSKVCALPQSSPFPDSSSTYPIFFPLPPDSTPLRVHLFHPALFKLIHTDWRRYWTYRLLEGNKTPSTLTLLHYFQSQTWLMNCSAHLCNCSVLSRISTQWRLITFWCRRNNYIEYLKHHITC